PGVTTSAPAVGGTGVVSALLGTLAAGASATFVLVVQVSAAAPDNSTLTNGASVGSATADPSPANNIAFLTATVENLGMVAVGAAAGPPPAVRVYDARTGAPVASFLAFGANFVGGVHVAVGDVNGDGVLDVIVGAGAGSFPHVKVVDGNKLAQTLA